jgi:hypothetical protein
MRSQLGDVGFCGTKRTCRSPRRMSVVEGRSQPVDATLILKKRCRTMRRLPDDSDRPAAHSTNPLLCPRGRHLFTLSDAGNYLTELPKAEHEAPE